MITQIPSASDDLFLTFKCTKTIEAADIESMEAALTPVLKSDKKMGLITDITELDDISEEGLKRDLEFELTMLKNLEHFPRVAIITDKQWPATLSKWVSHFLYQPKIRAFKPDESDQAREWVSGFQTTLQEKGGTRFMPTNQPHVLGLELDGIITVETIQDSLPLLHDFFSRHDQVNFLVKFKTFKGIDPKVYAYKDLVNLKLLATKKVKKYAIVGAPSWSANFFDFIRPLFPNIEIKIYGEKEENVAWIWLEAEPV